MKFIDINNPVWCRQFTSFVDALNIIETLSAGKPTVHGLMMLWNSIIETGSLYLGPTNEGHLYLVCVHTMNGTTYCASFYEEPQH